MNEQYPKLIWGAAAVSIYLLMVGILVFYFNTHKEKKPVNYVKKNEHRIQVALASAQKEQLKKPKVKKVKSKPKNKPKEDPKKKPKKKPEKKPKITKPKKTAKKKVIKEKVVKKVKKKDVNLTKPKKKKAVDLFANVKAPKKKNVIQITDAPVKEKPKKNFIKVTDDPMSASQRIADSLKQQKSMESGEENAYFAKVQSMLQAWPAQSEYAGEKATVLLYIKPSGQFEFQVTSGSDVDGFNRGLLSFLKQLQKIGFGRHNAGRTYEFEAEFIAKE